MYQNQGENMKRKPHPNYSGNPNVALTGIEYLLLKMQTEPGRSKRYYLKQKNIYQRGNYSKVAFYSLK